MNAVAVTEAALKNALAGLLYERGDLGQAWFSHDRDHRFLLTRGDLDGPGPLISFVMLNPSTATGQVDDNTIAKCRKYALREAHRLGGRAPSKEWIDHRVAIADLYAVRATDPDVAFKHPRPVGGETNDRIILELAVASDLIIAAWGADKRSVDRAAQVRRLLDAAGVRLHRIGPASKGGHPQHPLYLRGDLEMEIA